ncbi:MAG: UbiA family prenyltransferase, partial [Bacteroidota bacterium]
MESESKIALEENVDLAKSNSKLASFTELLKLRLSWLVVFSALISYFTVATKVEWVNVIMLIIGGTLVTGSANGFNQIIERNLDGLMKRTMSRPLPTSRLSPNEASVFCSILLALGAGILWFFNNPLSGVLGLLSTILYT